MDPNNALAHGHLGGALEFSDDRDDLDRAQEEYNRAVGLEPGNPWWANGAARVAMKRKDYQTAAKRLLALKATSPQSVDTDALMAAFYLSGQRDEALQVAASRAAELGKLDLGYCTIPLHPTTLDKNAQAMCFLAMSLASIDRTKTVALFHEMVAMDPDYEDGYYVLGREAAVFANNPDEALRLFSKVRAENDPVLLSNVRREMAQAYDRKGDHANAAAVYTLMLAEDPRSAWLHVALADELTWSDWDKAAEEYKNALELEPRNVHALVKLADYSNGEEQTAEALRYAKAALEYSNGSDGGAHVELGRALEAQHNNPAALAEYQRAMQLDPNNSDAKENYDRLVKVISGKK